MGMVYPRFFRRLTTMANQNHLMHPRAANNYADNGYFPTDSATLFGIVKRLDIAGNPNVLTVDIGTSRFGQGCSAHTCLVRVERYEGEAGDAIEQYREQMERLVAV